MGSEEEKSIPRLESKLRGMERQKIEVEGELLATKDSLFQSENRVKDLEGRISILRATVMAYVHKEISEQELRDAIFASDQEGTGLEGFKTLLDIV